MLNAIRKHLSRRRRAHDLYIAIVEQARDPAFYRDLGVADTVDGRFDLIALHAFLLLRRLKRDDGAAALAQDIFDIMFDDMDRSLREMGVGDLGVGKRVKTMAKAFYGRVAAYEAGLDADDDAALKDALLRNLYRGADPGPAALAAIAAYVRRQERVLAARPLTEIVESGRPFEPAQV